MRIYWSILVLVFCVMALSGCSLFNGRDYAGLDVRTTPQAVVYINGENVGKTPYLDEEIEPGDYTLRLEPQTSDLAGYETRITLHPGVKTVLLRELGVSSEQSSGYSISVEPQSEKSTGGMVVISAPDSALVALDGTVEGFSPISFDKLGESERVVSISSPGYYDRSLSVQVLPGYTIKLNVQLARSNLNTVQMAEQTSGEQTSAGGLEDELEEDTEDEDEEEAIDAALDIGYSKEEVGEEQSEDVIDTEPENEQVSEGEITPPYVVIQETSTGWLNARSEPSTYEDNVVKKLNPDESYRYVELNETGWYKIVLDDGSEAWISSKYAKLIKE